MPKADVHLR